MTEYDQAILRTAETVAPEKLAAAARAVQNQTALVFSPFAATGDATLDKLIAAVDTASQQVDQAVALMKTAPISGLNAALTQLVTADTALAQAQAALDSYHLPDVPPIDPPTTGTRVAWRWPYAADAWCNRRINKAKAVYGPSAGIGYGYVNSHSYSHATFYAKTTDPQKQVTGPWGSVTCYVPASAGPSGGTDGATVIIQPDGWTAYGFYQFQNGNPAHSQTMVKDDLRGNAFNVGWLSTTKIGVQAGMILKPDLLDAAKGIMIPHVLCMALPPEILGPFFQWPAAAQDGAKPEGQTGNGVHGPVNYGALLAIRPDVNLGTIGLKTTVGHSIAMTAQVHGFGVRDYGGQPVLMAEGSCEPVAGQPIKELADLRSDCVAIFKQLVIIGNACNVNPRVTFTPGTGDGGARLPADALPTLVPA